MRILDLIWQTIYCIVLDLDFNPNPNIRMLEFPPTTEDDIFKYVKPISSAKATGCDRIPMKYLQCFLNISSNFSFHHNFHSQY